MHHISNDKNIREFVRNILRTKKWEPVRQGKHLIIRHLEKNGIGNITVPSTPSCPHTFENFKKDYYRRLREYFIRVGLIFPSEQIKP